MILDASSICAKMDPSLSTFIHNIIMIIKIAVPIVLIIFGMIDLGKGVVASKEDEIKKGQSSFIKRLIAGIIVFFMVSISQLVIGIIDKESGGGFWSCANKIMNGTAGQTQSEDDEIERTNIIVRECCISAGGEIVDSKKGTSTCKTTEETEEQYNQCFINKKEAK